VRTKVRQPLCKEGVPIGGKKTKDHDFEGAALGGAPYCRILGRSRRGYITEEEDKKPEELCGKKRARATRVHCSKPKERPCQGLAMSLIEERLGEGEALAQNQ